MKKDERIAYSAAHIRRLKVFEKKYTPVIYRAIKSQIDDAAKVIREVGPQGAYGIIDRTLFNDKIHEAVMGIYRVVGVFYANRTLREINRSARGKKGFGFDEEWQAQIENFFRMHILSKAVSPITDTTKALILKVITKGFEQGWGVDQIIREMGRTDITLARARMIVRTESTKAVFYGEELAKEKSEFEIEQEWIAANDHRTRHSHKLIDGEIIKEGGRFQVPVFKRVGKVDIQIGVDLMKGPGDPEASAGNVVNCRCKRATIAARDEKGNLIMKTAIRT